MRKRERENVSARPCTHEIKHDGKRATAHAEKQEKLSRSKQ